jgi:hypothetical protein
MPKNVLLAHQKENAMLVKIVNTVSIAAKMAGVVRFVDEKGFQLI